ncbi:hypothetical protein T581_01508 [Mycobacterium tuberculosis UT0048]|nr:hypothetical protein T581_01508 [Mycobacterium tuberculosis UT0048]
MAYWRQVQPDPSYHVRLSALPYPGTGRDLGAFDSVIAGGASMAYWRQVQPDPSYHVRLSALPYPGTGRDLGALVG